MTTAASSVTRVQGNGITIAAETWPAHGERRGSILLLHGGGQTRHSWDKSAPGLAAAGWDTTTVDARGHGDTDWAEVYGMDVMVGDIADVTAALTDGHPVVIGASMGGITGLLAVGEGAVAARALVLVDVVPKIEPKGVERIRDFMLGHLDGFADLDEVAAAIQSYNPHRKRTTVDHEGLKKNVRLREDGRWYWHWDPRAMSRQREPDLDERFNRLEDAARAIRCPVLLVRGKHSDIVSDEGVQHLQSLVPHAEYDGAADAGHMVAGDDNNVFLDSVGAFLGRL